MSIEMSIEMPIEMSIEMLMKMSIKMSIEMSAENPILGTQRYFWRKWRKMTENGPRALSLRLKWRHTTAKSKIPENPGVPWFRVLFFKKPIIFKRFLLFFTIFHINYIGFSQKNAKKQENTIKPMVFQHFWAKTQ